MTAKDGSGTAKSCCQCGNSGPFGLGWVIVNVNRDDPAGSVARGYDLSERNAHLLEIRRFCREPAQRGTRAQCDAGQRLIYLMRDRCRQTSHRGKLHLLRLDLRATEILEVDERPAVEARADAHQTHA